MRGSWQRLLADFGKCGVAGWCLEVMFTSVDSILAGDFRLMGHTSLLMFPIYGLGAFAAPVSTFLDAWLSGLPGSRRPADSSFRSQAGYSGMDCSIWCLYSQWNI